MKIPIGFHEKSGLTVYVEERLIATHGLSEIKRLTGVYVPTFSFQIDLSGNQVHIKAETEEKSREILKSSMLKWE